MSECRDELLEVAKICQVISSPHDCAHDTPQCLGIIILSSSPLHLVLHSHVHFPMINQLLYVLVVFACTFLEHLFVCLPVTSSRKMLLKNMYAFF